MILDSAGRGCSAKSIFGIHEVGRGVGYAYGRRTVATDFNSKAPKTNTPIDTKGNTMKTKAQFLTMFVALAVPLPLLAQPGMDPEQMQQMMQQMQGMQDCMGGMDSSAMEEYQQKAEQMNKEVKALCAAGKRDEAHKRAMAFGKETAKTPGLKNMQKCVPNLKGMMPEPTASNQPDREKTKPHHICDDLE
jgi:hypothetical protein